MDLTKEERARRVNQERALLTGKKLRGGISLMPCAVEGGGVIQGSNAEDHVSGLYPLDPPIPPQSAYLISPNPCVRVFGPGPRGTACLTCRHKQLANETIQIPCRGRNGATTETKQVTVCEFRGESHTPTGTWYSGLESCGKYEP